MIYNTSISKSQITRLEKIVNDFVFVDNKSFRFRYSHCREMIDSFCGKNHFAFLPAQTQSTMGNIKKLFDFLIIELMPET